MDFSVEHGYSYLRILAGNEEPVSQFRLSLPTAAKAGGLSQWESCARTFWGELLLLTNWYRAGESPCAKSVPESDLFMPLGLALSEKQIPQIAENTEKSK